MLSEPVRLPHVTTTHSESTLTAWTSPAASSSSPTLKPRRSDYLTSVDVIEALTGLDFLTKEVPDDVEAKIEAIIQTKLWD